MKAQTLCLKTSPLVLILLLLAATLTPAQTDPSRIDIVRDSFGVPHIFAPTDAEVAYGFAWANAEDDFETMQWLLLVAKGMLSEFKNMKKDQGMLARNKSVDGAVVDYVYQMLRIKDVVEEKYETDFSDKFKAILKAYAAGINDYAAKHPEEIIVDKVFPIDEKDLVGGYVIASCLMSGVVGVLEDIFNGNAGNGDVRNGGMGSNALAFHSSRTKDSVTYLSGNPHQPLEGPFSWYEAHLCSDEGWNIVGACFSGSPVIMIGANEHLGWTHTINQVDLIDTYQLQMHPQKKDHYWFDGQWEKLESRKAKLKVTPLPGLNLKLQIAKKTYWSKYGATVKSKGNVYSIRFGANQDIRVSEQYYWMNKARNFSEFYDALRRNALCRMTTLYADRYDTVFVVSTGKVPVRNPKYNWLGVLPGNTSETLWSEFHPLEKLPQILNPKCGVVFNANNTAFDATSEEENLDPRLYDPTMGYTERKTNRGLRVHELLKTAPEKMDYNDFKAIKYDRSLPTNIVPFENFDVKWFSELDPAEYPDIAGEIKQLQRWNGEATLDNQEISLYLYTFYQLFQQKNNLRTGLLKDKNLILPILAQCVREAKKEMLARFGATLIPLSEAQRHARGGVNIPIDGGPDILRSFYCLEKVDGRLRVSIGDSYILFVRFEKDGPMIETISPFGASSKPGSPHYTDQMEMFANSKLKPMSLDKETIYKKAVRIYHPK